MLGMGERTFRRWRDRLRDEGPSGLADRRLGKPTVRRAKAAEIARMLELYSGSYADFTVKHFHGQLSKRHDYKPGYAVRATCALEQSRARCRGHELGDSADPFG
jgi:hypothetical protein